MERDIDLEVMSDDIDAELVEGNVYINYVDDFTGATSQAAGSDGLVPAPSRGEQNKALFGDANWGALGVDYSHDGMGQMFVRVTKTTVSTSGGGVTPVVTDLGGTTIPSANESQDGLMSAADKSKLDNIDEMDALTSEELAAILV